MRFRFLFVLAALTVTLLSRAVFAAQGGGNPQEEAALQKNAEAFVEAFHKGDAKAVAALWTPDGDYTDETGRTIKGREAIEKSFADFFTETPGAKVRIDIAAQRFVTPDVVIEDGTTAVIPPDGGPPSRARYTNVHVKKDGQWYLSSVREAPFAPPTNYAHLHELEWLIGEWAGETPRGNVPRIAYTWGPNQNFIIGSYTSTFKNMAIGGGTQWIGFDVSAKAIRSWFFNNNGGLGEGLWSRDGNRYTVKTSTVTPDGKKVTATDTVTRVDADTVSVQSKDRTVDGKPQADGPEIKMKRVK